MGDVQLGASSFASRVQALTGSQDGVFVGGDFDQAGGLRALHVAQWNGEALHPVGKQGDLNGGVLALEVFDDGTGQAVYVGGNFQDAAGIPEADGIARWDGREWSALGNGIPFGAVHALAVHDDGGGPDLYVGGSFLAAGGAPTDRLARWDGVEWSSPDPGSEPNGNVYALESIDIGFGPFLVVGGDFTAPGDRAAVFTGTALAPLASGLNGRVEDFAVYDDGGGPALFAGGWFTAPVAGVARFEQGSWVETGTGSGLNFVRDLEVHDDGSGSALWAAGTPGVGGDRLRRWDGTSWTTQIVGNSPRINALAVFDPGSGPVLLAAGAIASVFDGVASLPAGNVGYWDGTGWMPLGRGVVADGIVGIESLVVLEGSCSSELFAGGFFTAGAAGDSYLTRFGCNR